MPGLFPDTDVRIAQIVVTGGVWNCRVVATISPTPDSRIGVEYRLPATTWNGKFLGLGGGGLGGSITQLAFSAPLQRGYAVAQTDTGHTTAEGVNWALIAPGVPHVDRVRDFAWRSVERMTVIGKMVVAAYYGSGPARSYWQGCSTGGRQGLLLAQRFPAYYDGIIAGAPVYTTRLQANGLWTNTFTHAAGGTPLTMTDLNLIHAHVLARFDGLDGVRDGFIDNPMRFEDAWDPAEVRLLDPAKVEVVRRLYEGPRLADGTPVYPGRVLGSERQWDGAVSFKPDGINAVMLRTMVVFDPTYDALRFDIDTDLAAWDAALVSVEGNAGDPDIRDFVRRGSKLLLYHGWNDGEPNPKSTIDYFEAVEAVLEADPQLRHGNPGQQAARVRESVRLFMVPGMNHCGGGPGPNSFDMLTALEQWVERGKAPNRIIARNNARNLERPLCPYPEVARYAGSGSTNDAANFACVNDQGLGAGPRGR